jgi:hypothetical protein
MASLANMKSKEECKSTILLLLYSHKKMMPLMGKGLSSLPISLCHWLCLFEFFELNSTAVSLGTFHSCSPSHRCTVMSGIDYLIMQCAWKLTTSEAESSAVQINSSWMCSTIGNHFECIEKKQTHIPIFPGNKHDEYYSAFYEENCVSM